MAAVLDLTSALYLAELHPSTELPGWTALTTGRPAALMESCASRRVARRLASRVGCEDGLLARSTLHALADCVAVLAGPATPVVTDRGLYPVGEWAAQWHRGRGGAWLRAPHHDAGALRGVLARLPGPALVVADGWCTGCGRALPLNAYLGAIEDLRALLVLDDTQALGVLGAAPAAGDRYGRGGGGTPAWMGVRSPRLLVVSSAAKALGVPTAVISGPGELIERLREQAPSRVQSSPPSAAEVAALQSALARDDAGGDGRRRRLADLVARLRARLRSGGLVLRGGLFPVQTLPALLPQAALGVYRRLLADGVQTVLQHLRCRPGASVTLLVTTALTPYDVDRVAAAVQRAWRAEVHHSVA